MSNPVCPHCKTEMKARQFLGYYDEFSFWACECKPIPGATVQTGAYAMTMHCDGDLYETEEELDS